MTKRSFQQIPKDRMEIHADPRNSTAPDGTTLTTCASRPPALIRKLGQDVTTRRSFSVYSGLSAGCGALPRRAAARRHWPTRHFAPHFPKGLGRGCPKEPLNFHRLPGNLQCPLSLVPCSATLQRQHSFDFCISTPRSLSRKLGCRVSSPLSSRRFTRKFQRPKETREKEARQ